MDIRGDPNPREELGMGTCDGDRDGGQNLKQGQGMGGMSPPYGDPLPSLVSSLDSSTSATSEEFYI